MKQQAFNPQTLPVESHELCDSMLTLFVGDRLDLLRVRDGLDFFNRNFAIPGEARVYYRAQLLRKVTVGILGDGRPDTEIKDTENLIRTALREAHEALQKIPGEPGKLETESQIFQNSEQFY